MGTKAGEQNIEEGGAKQAKKEKKTKEPKEAGVEGKKKEKPAKAPAAPAADESSGEPVPSMIDLRIGHIVDSECYSRGTIENVQKRFEQSKNTLMRTGCTLR